MLSKAVEGFLQFKAAEAPSPNTLGMYERDLRRLIKLAEFMQEAKTDERCRAPDYKPILQQAMRLARPNLQDEI